MTVSSCFNAAKESTAPTTWRTSTSCPWTEVASPPDSSWPQETTCSDWSNAEDGYARNSRMTYFQRLRVKFSADLVPGASSTNCLRPRPLVAAQGTLPSASNAEKAKLEAQRWVTSPCLRALGSQELIHSSGDQNKHRNLIELLQHIHVSQIDLTFINFFEFQPMTSPRFEGEIQLHDCLPRSAHHPMRSPCH